MAIKPVKALLFIFLSPFLFSFLKSPNPALNYRACALASSHSVRLHPCLACTIDSSKPVHRSWQSVSLSMLDKSKLIRYKNSPSCTASALNDTQTGLPAESPIVAADCFVIRGIFLHFV
jgi:hypothetical protein